MRGLPAPTNVTLMLRVYIPGVSRHKFLKLEALFRGQRAGGRSQGRQGKIGDSMGPQQSDAAATEGIPCIGQSWSERRRRCTACPGRLGVALMSDSRH